MKSPLRLLGFLFVLLTLTGGAVWAATQNALVTGSVFDQNGAAVPGATVRLLNASIGFSQTLPTDANGNYTFGSVPPAENYVMSVEISGFATVIRPGLSVAVGEAKLVLPPFILQPAAQPGQEIREEAPAAAPVALEMVSTTLGGVVDSRALRTLPLVGRDFIDLALLIPGTYPVEQGSALEGASLVTNGVRGGRRSTPPPSVVLTISSATGAAAGASSRISWPGCAAGCRMKGGSTSLASPTATLKPGRITVANPLISTDIT